MQQQQTQQQLQENTGVPYTQPDYTNRRQSSTESQVLQTRRYLTPGVLKIFIF